MQGMNQMGLHDPLGWLPWDDLLAYSKKNY